MKVKLDQVNIVVGDMESMAGFYGRLGVDLAGGGGSLWAPHHRNASDAHQGSAAGGVDLDLDSPAFAAVWNEGWPGGTGIVLGFRVAERGDVDRLYDELTAAGHAGQQPPYDAFWGARYAVVADPDGNSVGIMSPPDESRRTRSPEPPTS